MATRLTVELVPSTCWSTNVRSHVPKAVWDRLRRQVAADAGNRCEIWGGRGRRWPVECHEVWHYDDDRKIQRLERLAALCPACHEVKHGGLASERGRLSAMLLQQSDRLSFDIAEPQVPGGVHGLSQQVAGSLIVARPAAGEEHAGPLEAGAGQPGDKARQRTGITARLREEP